MGLVPEVVVDHDLENKTTNTENNQQQGGAWVHAYIDI